jgi:hypothetical protein
MPTPTQQALLDASCESLHKQGYVKVNGDWRPVRIGYRFPEPVNYRDAWEDVCKRLAIVCRALARYQECRHGIEGCVCTRIATEALTEAAR